MLVGMAISMFGYVSGMMLAVPRALYAFGRDGFLPSAVAAIHPRFHTPHIAIAAQALIVAVIATTGSFETLAVIANGSVLLVYAGCCLAVLRLRRLGIEQSGTPFRVPFAAVIPVLAFLVVAWLLTSLSLGEWKWLIGILVVSAIVFTLTTPSRRARSLAVEGR